MSEHRDRGLINKNNNTYIRVNVWGGSAESRNERRRYWNRLNRYYYENVNSMDCGNTDLRDYLDYVNDFDCEYKDLM